MGDIDCGAMLSYGEEEDEYNYDYTERDAVDLQQRGNEEVSMVRDHSSISTIVSNSKYQEKEIAELEWHRTEESSKLLLDSITPNALQNGSTLLSLSSSSISIEAAFPTVLMSLLITSKKNFHSSFATSAPVFPGSISSLAIALSALVPFLTSSEIEKTIAEVRDDSKKYKKRVHFCGVDGSSVLPPGKDCSFEPALKTARRLHSLIGSIDELIANILTAEGNCTANHYMLDTFLLCCRILADPSSVGSVSEALFQSLSLPVAPGDLRAVAGLFVSELSAAKSLLSLCVGIEAVKEIPQSLAGTRTLLRYRTSWMTTSVLRAQLRWLLDLPPAYITVPTASGHPSSPFIRSEIYKFVTLREAPSSASAANKKKRRKSDLTLMDHTVVMPWEMNLSSLLTQALRQIYDAFISAIVSSPSQASAEPSADILVTNFLVAAVTGSVGEEEDLCLEGLEQTQPQLALAAERGKNFLQSLLLFPAVQSRIALETNLWTTVQESALLLSNQGMSEDRHLCLLAGGWRGLLRFSNQRLLTIPTEAICSQYVDSLEKAKAKQGQCISDQEDTMLLNDSLIYDFPQIVLKLSLS